LSKIGAMSQRSRVVLPADLTKVDDLLKGVGLDVGHDAVPKQNAASSHGTPVPEPMPVAAKRGT
jgi:hypothetical protein